MSFTKRIFSLASMVLITLAILVTIGPRSQAKAADCFNPYAVGPTESWHSIANVCKIDFQALRDANPTHIRHRDILYTGEQLTLPGRDDKPAGGATVYTVKPGDSWYRIAQDHNLTFRDVRAFNPKLWLRRGIIIRTGDEILLPLVAPAPVTVETPPTVEVTPTVEAPPTGEVTTTVEMTETVEAPAASEGTQPAIELDASGCPADLDLGPSYLAGGLVKVISLTPLDLYAEKADTANVTGQAATDTILKVLTDTECINGWLWWQVTDEARGLTGWVTAELLAMPVLDSAE